MRMRPGTSGWIRWSQLALVALVLFSSVALLSSDKSPYSPSEKAFYADEAVIAFVRPGLTIKIVAHEIATDGTVKVRYKLTDPKGLPLDRLGITTPGTISTSFILARIPANEPQYVSYTVRTQTSPITGVSAVQAGADSGGTFAQVGDGEYTYTFRTKLPANYDRTATHTIGAYGSRNLSEFDLGTNYDDDIYRFIPMGAAVTKLRDVVADATCNTCHSQLAFHGGSRRTVEVCNLCHTPQTVDPDTGNTVDMKVMVHKIHMGSSLPSVEGGKDYIIIGNSQSVHNYSEIAYPPGANTCETCHKEGTTQWQLAFTNPTRSSCGSCHDDVNFATGEKHLGGPQPSDNLCKNCHIPEGELEFDASIKGAHVNPKRSSMLPGMNFEIVSVTNNKAGQKPNVQFKVFDDAGKTIQMADIGRVALVLAGPTTDYVGASSHGYISEDPKAGGATLSGDVYTYAFKAAIPADAKGSYTIGIEGRRTSIIMQGTTQQQSVQYGADNKVVHFSVDSSQMVPRRQIVTTAKCNSCHFDLVLHGDNRNKVEQCVLCHNPVETDAARRAADKMPAESIDMAQMIHRIHAGLEQTRDYTIYGFGNTPHNYNHIGFPAPLSTCTLCHVDGTQTVPVKAVADKRDPRGYMDPVKPATAACLGCHTSLDAASHALANTSSLGESCGTCHGTGKTADVLKVHAQ